MEKEYQLKRKESIGLNASKCFRNASEKYFIYVCRILIADDIIGSLKLSPISAMIP